VRRQASLDELAQLGGQLVGGLLDRAQHHGGEEAAVRVGHAGVPGLERGGARPDAAAGLVGGGVHGDAVQPGGEGGLLPEARGAPQRGHEGLLGGVLSVLAVAEHAQADAVHAALVPAHQLPEGVPVPPQVRSQQLLVAGPAHDFSVASTMPPR
jgi:hypothetical protein